MLKKLLNTTNNSSLNKRKNLAKFLGNLCITVSFKTIQHGSSNVIEIFRAVLNFFFFFFLTKKFCTYQKHQKHQRHKDAAKQKYKKHKNANKQISHFFPLRCFLCA